MVIEHNKIEKVKENLLTKGEIRVTIFNFTRLNISSKVYKCQFFLARNTWNMLSLPSPNF